MINFDNGVFNFKGTGKEMIADIATTVFAVRQVMVQSAPESKREEIVKRYEHLILSVLAAPYDADESQAAEIIIKAIGSYNKNP